MNKRLNAYSTINFDEVNDLSPEIMKIKQAGKLKSGRDTIKEALFIEVADDRILKMQKCESVRVYAVKQTNERKNELKCLKYDCENWEESAIKVFKDVIITAKLRVYGVLQTNFMRFRRNIQGLPLRKRKSKDTLNCVISCIRKQTSLAYVVWNAVKKMWKKKLRVGFFGILRVRNNWAKILKGLHIKTMHNYLTSILLYSIVTNYRKKEILKSSNSIIRTLKKINSKELKIYFFNWRNFKHSVVPKQKQKYIISLSSILFLAVVILSAYFLR